MEASRTPQTRSKPRNTRESDLPAAIMDEMIERADGVPLFLEELAKAVVDGGNRPVPGHPTVVDSSAPIPWPTRR